MHAPAFSRHLALADWRLPVTGAAAVHLTAWCGLDQLQVDFGGPGRAPCLSDPARQARLRAACTDSGVRLTALSVNALNDIGLHAAPSTQAGEQARRVIAAALDVAAALTIPLASLPSFRRSAIRDERELAATAAVLRWACAEAAARGVSLANENDLSTDKVSDLLRQVDDPGLWLVLDTYNPVAAGVDIGQLIRAQHPRWHPHIHVKDGLHGNNVLLGKGDGGVAATLRLLGKHPQRCLVLENDYRQRDGLERLRRDWAWLLLHHYLITDMETQA